MENSGPLNAHLRCCTASLLCVKCEGYRVRHYTVVSALLGHTKVFVENSILGVSFRGPRIAASADGQSGSVCSTACRARQYFL